MGDAFTVSELVNLGADRLSSSGSSSPRLDAELLLGKALGTDRTGILAHPSAPVSGATRHVFEDLIGRRERGEPVAYIRGFREFYGLVFATDARALIPRPETEQLVDAAVADLVRRLTGNPRSKGAPALRVADVGTGTGAIAVSLTVALRRRGMDGEVLVVAIDVSDEALQLARENAVGHAVADRMVFLAADLIPHHVDPPYALVCANLPYVPTVELERLASELSYDLSFEPRVALDGGPDGLDVIRRLLDLLPTSLASDGVVLLEIGADQAQGLRGEVAQQLPGWRCTVSEDLAGRPRLARIERPPG
jgi:release factor glutamine methyltransferase